MNTKKIISLISCMTVIVSGLMGRSNISFAENSADYINTTTAVVAENTTETATTSNDTIDVFFQFMTLIRNISRLQSRIPMNLFSETVLTFQHSSMILTGTQ